MVKIKNFFNDYKDNRFTIHIGESKNLSQEMDLQKKAKNLALEVSSLGYISHFYEKVPRELYGSSESKEYVLYLHKNKFSFSAAFLNMQSKFSDKIRKIKIPQINSTN